jgi:DinB superfamily
MNFDAKQKDVRLPDVGQMTRWIQQVRAMALAALDSATEDHLRGPRAGKEWFEHTGRPAGDVYMRTICHTMAHVRQIWILRNAMGLVGQTAWPQQHYA